MLAWVLEVLQSFIGVLQVWQTQGATGEVTALVTFVSAIVVPIGAFFLLVRRRARRRYQKGLDDLDEARNDLAAKQESIRTLQAEKRQKDTQIALLERMAPAGFARAMEAHHRDGNTEFEVRDAQAYIDFHRTALRRAFGVLTDDLIGHAATEGTVTFAIALSHAQAALALTPEDENLRELAAELAEAATIAPHAAVKLPTPEDRAERLAQRAALPNDLQALQSAYFAADAKGQYQLSLTLARHAVRNTRRAFGAASEPHVTWSVSEARSLRDLGRPSEALTGLQTLLPAAKATIGADHPQVLFVRFFIASCLRETGAVSAALQAVQDLLLDKVRVLGPTHHETLATRQLIAACLQDTGEAAAALQAARDLLPVDERVRGAEHPGTLSTRMLIAFCLYDTGDAAAALQAARDLQPVEERVRGAEHPDTLTTRHLIVACLWDTGEATAALQTARDLLPVMERVKGAGHPGTLGTRTLLAGLLLDSGSTAEAAEAHRGVRDALAAGGIGPGHRYVKRAIALDERLAQLA